MRTWKDTTRPRTQSTGSGLSFGSFSLRSLSLGRFRSCCLLKARCNEPGERLARNAVDTEPGQRPLLRQHLFEELLFWQLQQLLPLKTKAVMRPWQDKARHHTQSLSGGFSFGSFSLSSFSFGSFRSCCLLKEMW